jgi:diguanylate cyclase (GGDEF)-like protein/PAS domain S-box-containing protein
MINHETVRLAKDGRIIPIEQTAVVLKDNGGIAGYASIMRDITERKRMEAALAESRENLRIIFDSSQSAIFIHDLDGRIIDVNRKMLEMYRVDYDRALALSIGADYSSPDNPVHALRETWEKVLAGQSMLFEWKARRPGDGSLFDAEVFLKKINLKRKEVILAAVTDISRRKQAEQTLKLMQFSVDHASVSVFMITPDARFLYVNRQACKSLGYSREEMLSLRVPDIDPDYPRSVWDEHWATLKKEESLHFETTHRRKDGIFVPMDLSLNFLSFGGQEYNIAFGLDITKRKKAEQELAKISRRNELILESAGEGIFGINSRGDHIFINRAGSRMLGYGEGELAGRHSHPIWHHSRADETPYPEEKCNIYRTARDGVSRQVDDEVFWKKDGTPVPVEYTTTPIREGGDIVGTVVTFRDVTERKQAEESLKRAYAGLETKVRERTRELARANDELRMEVAERKRAVELIRKSKELSDALNNLGTVIHSSLDIGEILQRVVEEGAKSLKVDASMIGLLEDGIFRIHYVYRLPDAFLSRTLTRNELRGLHHAAEAGDAVAFNDAFNDERLNRRFVREMGIRSLIVAPITIRNKIEGAITYYGLSRRIEFGEEHLDFARKLGASVSLALENARLYNALQKAEKLSASRFKQLQTIYDTAPVGLCFIDTNLRYVSINRRLAEINDVSIEKTIGRGISEVVKDEPGAAQRIEALVIKAIQTGEPVENVEIVRKTKEAFIVSSNFYPVTDQAGAVAGVNIVVQDISQRKRAEEALRKSERRLNAILNSISDMAWFKDREGRFILVNDAFAASAGKKADDLPGKTDFDVWPKNLAEKYIADDREVMHKGVRKRFEEPLAGTDGMNRWIETIKTPIYDETGAVTGTVGIARDVTDRKRMEEEIRHMAQHDALTGLPNRRLFLDLLKVEIAQARRHRTKLAVLFLDLDRFKEINDTLGHETGDQLLKEVARRFRKTIRESDTVARIGGDEFNMVLSDIAVAEGVSEIAVKIVKSLADPVIIGGHELHISTSVGVSIFPDDSEEIETLLRYADIAMYHAKESGRNTFRFYNPSINIRSIEKMRLESRLRQAIARGELAVHYQPLIDIKTNRISYAEALVRWNHPERGLLDPKEFLPLAEETGFITSIDEWVLKTVCAQARSWKESGFDSFCVTVNLSARQFQSPDLVKMVSSVLSETGMSPRRLDIEVTENTAMSNIEQTVSQLRKLTGMGVHISIDDFGTGYSSLNYLKKLPIERIKIDKSFISDIATDPDDRAIISAVTSMARQMGLRTVAEGVENEEQLAFVKEAGCDEVQGFLMSRPLPPERFREMAMGR